MRPGLRLERELSLELVRVTEAAAIEAAALMGRGDTEAVDRVAVDAMRAILGTVHVRGRVVIGEGEMDEAPMLYIGEELGAGPVPVDIAVDPVEGTSLVAKGLPGAVAVLAVAPQGTLLNAPDMYMQKLVAGPAARGALDLDDPIAVNLERVAERMHKRVDELSVVILERERHRQLIAQVRAAGARIKLITDGDVAPAVAAAIPGTGVDVVAGIGGAPEGVLAAAALVCLGGEMQARLVADTAEQAERARAMGVAPGRILGLSDLVRGDDVIFAATGITDGELVRGVRFEGVRAARSHSVVMRSRTGTVRFVDALHHLDRKPFFRERPPTGGAGERTQ